MPSLVVAVNPFDPAERTVKRVPKNRRIGAMCPKSEFPVVCFYNGRVLLRAGWKRRIKHGDVVQFVAFPRGGGGGGGLLKMVGMMALTYFTMGAGAGAWATAANGFGTVTAAGAFSGLTMSGMMVGMGMYMVGAALLSALLPAPKLPTPQAMADMSMAAASPTYNITAQGNTARLEQPIPVQYGRHIAYPDFAAVPYTEYADNEQWLYQLFVVGQGYHDIEEIRIEDTPIQNFDGVTTEVIQPGGSLTLFPAAVTQATEVSGGTLDDGPLGPYTANPSGTLANYIGVDLVCPGGLYYANDSGGLNGKSLTVRFEARQIDDEGDPVGGWITLGTETIDGATNTAIRKSYRYAVASARYQVKATRTDSKDTSSRAAHSVAWGGCRAYLPDERDYGDLTLLAVRIKATSQLSQQASRKINVIGTRKLPTWNPTTGWSAPVATRSIAWALADICRARYAANLADDRYDLPALYALDAVWTTRGDTFDARYDGKQTTWEALTNTARAGRAKPYQQSGMVRFWRDSPQTIPTAIFTPRNIKAGSFSMEFAPAITDTSDAVRTSYFDERYWSQRDALCYTAGSAASNPADVQAFGMIQRRQVVAEGMYMAAANRYRRRIVSFSTEAEGLIPRFGDLIGISHDMPSWGQSGDVLAWDAATKTAILSEPPTWTEGQTHYVRLVKADGSVTGNIAVTAGTTEYSVVLAVDPGFTPETSGQTRERSRYVFGVAGRLYTEALITRIAPKDGLEVEISAVVEDARVHSADGSTVPDSTTDNLPTAPSAPVVSGLVVSEGGTPSAPVQYVSWQRADGADQYWVESTTDGVNWQRQDTTTATASTIKGVPAGQYLNIRVAGVGLLRGPWVSWLGTSGGTVAIPGDIADLALESTFLGPEAVIRWSPAARATGYTVQVWQGGTKRRERIITDTRFVYTADDAKQDGGPWRSFEFRVIPMGVGNGATASLTVSNPQVAQLNNVQVVSNATGALWSCQPPSDPDIAGFLVYASKTTGFTPGESNLIYEGKSAIRQLPLEPNKVWYVRSGAYDAWGKDSAQLTGEFTVNTGAVGAEHISVANLSAIVANMGEIIAGRMHSADNAVDFDLNAKTLRVMSGTQERVKLGLLSAGNYGLKVTNAAGTKSAALTADVGTIIASGSVAMPTSLNADGTYEVEITLPSSFAFSDLTVIVDADDVPAYNLTANWSYFTSGGYSITQLHPHIHSGGSYRERDGNAASGRPKYKAHTVSNMSADYNVVCSTYIVTRWNKGSATSGDKIYLQGSKNLQVYDRTANEIKALIEIGWPVQITYTVIARNYQG